MGRERSFPIPDELVCLVPAEQLRELFNFLTAIADRALTKQARLTMRLLRHPKLSFCCGNVCLRYDLNSQAVEHISVAATVAVNLAVRPIRLFEVDRDVLYPSEGFVRVDDRIGAVGGGDLGEFLEGHVHLPPAQCGFLYFLQYSGYGPREGVHVDNSVCYSPLPPANTRNQADGRECENIGASEDAPDKSLLLPGYTDNPKHMRKTVSSGHAAITPAPPPEYQRGR